MMQDKGFIKLMRSDKTLALMANPNAFTLASVIACRAQRTTAFNIHGLEPGEALLGDHESYGMSRCQYRTAKKELATWGIAAFRATSKGTIAKLIGHDVYDIHQEPSDNPRDHPTTNERPSRDHYQECENAKVQEQNRNVYDKRTPMESGPSRRTVDRRDCQRGDSAFGQTIQA
ncbi:MAG: hypothetical protein JW955_17990 [Sedimentisphaerales bacterium]|nr:hypothetical protein [Sedimentisphaerales bacterium]